MICVSIGDYGFESCQKSIRKCEKLQRDFPDVVAEFRLDLCGLSESQVTELFISSKVPLIATCRKRSKNLYAPAILGGAQYVDIDVLSSKTIINEVSDLIRGKNVKRIFSYHDYQGTPSLQSLKDIYAKAVDFGGDIVKIVTSGNSVEDAERLLGLYDLRHKGKLGAQVPLIAFAMGMNVAYSRFESHSMGAPFLFCSLNEKGALAPGMPSISLVKELSTYVRVEGEVVIPTSKSVAQRAIIAAALAKGESEFHNFSSCRDIDSAVGVARQLSSKVYSEGNTLFVRGTGFSVEKNKTPFMTSDLSSAIQLQDTSNIFVGESGLLSRLCIPLAAQTGKRVTVTGEGSLLGREMYGCKEAMEQFKANCLLTADETLPAEVVGPLHAGKVTISGKKGSQLISGLLMALPLCKKESVLTVDTVTSVPYIMLTIDVIRKFGINVSIDMDDNNMVFTIPGKQKYSTVEMTLEGDWSSASNFVVAAAIFGDIVLRGLDAKSHQADREVLKIVKECGAFVDVLENGIRVRRGHLLPFDYDATHSPDLFPILAVLAAYCEGTSTIHGINRLRNKECNRTIAICQEFGKMGVVIEVEGDSMHVTGTSMIRRVIEKSRLKGGDYQSFGDHRIAMALMVASIGCKEKVHVDNMDCVDKSFPTFMKLFSSILK